jgi:PBP1b-binding outer membrane lipoprotein LpoB
MKRLYLILAVLLMLAVVISGCVGKSPGEQSQQNPTSQASTLDGNITVPGENDLQIEDVQASPAEVVDMGSLI